MRYMIDEHTGAPFAADIGKPWIRIDDPELTRPRPFWLRLASDKGRLFATGLLLAGPEVELMARDLRQVKLPAVLEALNAPIMSAPVAQLLHQRQEAPGKRTRPGRAGYPDAHYRRVAAAYERAKRAHPRAPIQHLVEELNASEPTIHRWLRTARERGMLEERS